MNRTQQWVRGTDHKSSESQKSSVVPPGFICSSLELQEEPGSGCCASQEGDSAARWPCCTREFWAGTGWQEALALPVHEGPERSAESRGSVPLRERGAEATGPISQLGRGGGSVERKRAGTTEGFTSYWWDQGVGGEGAGCCSAPVSVPHSPSGCKGTLRLHKDPYHL